MSEDQPRQLQTVAVVGSGLAGLVTAYLLNQDPQRRFQVTLLEKVGASLALLIPEPIWPGVFSDQLTTETAKTNLSECGIHRGPLSK